MAKNWKWVHKSRKRRRRTNKQARRSTPISKGVVMKEEQKIKLVKVLGGLLLILIYTVMGVCHLVHG